MPRFLREGFLPLAAFYLAWRLAGLGAGIAASTAVSALLYVHERRAGRDGLLLRLTLAFVVVTGAVGLLSDSTTVYLGTPVVANAIWAVAFIGSVPLGRPLAGTFACAWYPFTREFRASAAFKRVYGVESVVWGLYLGARSALRLAALLHGGVGAFVLVTFVTGAPSLFVVLVWSIWYAVRKLSDEEPRPRRTGPLRQRLALRALRGVGVALWRIGARLGIDVLGAIQGPPFAPDGPRRDAFERLIADARAGDGTVDTSACPYPVHELLTYLVVEHGLLLHGSNAAALELLEPQPSRDFDTELRAVVACDDGIWPIFYAVVDRDRVANVFTACMHLGRPPRLRRLYAFALWGDPAWTRGSVYALPRDRFRREWGREWVTAAAVRPLLRVPVAPADFPLRESVVGLSTGSDLRRIGRYLRAAKRARAAAEPPLAKSA